MDKLICYINRSNLSISHKDKRHILSPKPRKHILHIVIAVNRRQEGLDFRSSVTVQLLLQPNLDERLVGHIADVRRHFQ